MRQMLKKFCEATDVLVNLERWLAVVLAGIFMSLLALQIILRFFFQSPIYGIEEAVTGMVVWFAAFGAVVVTRENGHAQVEYFLRFFPEKARKWLNAGAYGLGCWIGILMVKGGLKLFSMQKKALPAGGLPFSKAYYYALPIIVLGVSLGIVCIACIIRILDKEEKEREGGDII